MFARSLPRSVLLCLLLGAASGFPLVARAAEADPADTERLTAILTNMPVNSDQRCVGIAGVAEALLGGMPTDGTLAEAELPALAERIFAAFRSGEQVEYPAAVVIEGEPVSMTAPAALERLVTRVADVYKQHHSRLVQSEAGIQQLLSAEAKRVRSLAELDKLLAADPDQLDFFCCFGRRRFPDGSEKETSHAVLLRRSVGAGPVVLDPNDPGKDQQAKYFETENGLEVEWTCPYRETGQVTTQRYHIVPKGWFFQAAFSAEKEQPAARSPPTEAEPGTPP